MIRPDSRLADLISEAGGRDHAKHSDLPSTVPQARDQAGQLRLGSSIVEAGDQEDNAVGVRH